MGRAQRATISDPNGRHSDACALPALNFGAACFSAPNRFGSQSAQTLKTVTSLNKEARLLKFHFS